MAFKPILLAKANQSVVYEAGLAFFFGKSCHNVSVSDASTFISGFTIANDIGNNILEKRTSQWVSGKMFDTFTPMGPLLLTADEITDPHNLTIQAQLNGEIVQKANTADMFFNIFEITSYLSTLTTLQPGDVILTGCPKLINGQPVQQKPLQPNGQLDITISQLGTLTNTVHRGE